MNRLLASLRGLSTVVVLVSCLLCAPSPARAQDEGRQLFEVGVSAYSRGAYPEALAAFEAAYATDGLPGVLYNIAMCQRALDRAPDAVNTFRRYLDLDQENVTPDVLREVNQQIETMRAGFGDVVVTVDVSGATVVIDDRVAGTSPIGRPVALAPGEHTVLARHEARARAVEARVSVDAGESLHVELSLEEATAQPPTTTPEEVEPQRPEAEPPREGLGWWFWASMAVSATAIAGFTVTGGLTLHYRSEYLDSDRLDLEAYDTAVALGQGTDALLGVAAGMAAIAVVAVIVHAVRRRRARRPEPATADRWSHPLVVSLGSDGAGGAR